MFELIQQLDGQLLVAIQSLHQPLLDSLVSWFTQLGNAGLMWIVLSLAMLCWKPTRRAGALALMAMALGLLITNITIKPLVERARPWLDWPIVPLVVENDPNSFPSGHTCAAFAAGLSWAKALPKRWMGRLAVVLAVCMGLSRLYVGVHYPTDVLVGAVIGALCAWAAWKLYQIWQKRTEQSERA